MIVFVLAADENFGIGKGDELPWSFKKDMQFFKALTMGYHVAFGRKTWEAIKEPSKGLLGRRKIVIGKTDQPSEYDQFESIDQTLYFESTKELIQRSTDGEVIMVAGGKQLYESLYAHVDFAVVTQVHQKFDCNVFIDSSIQKVLPQRMISYKIKDVDRNTQNAVNITFTIYGRENYLQTPPSLISSWRHAIESIKTWFDPRDES